MSGSFMASHLSVTAVNVLALMVSRVGGIGSVGQTEMADFESQYWECRRNPTWKSGGVDYDECKSLTTSAEYVPRHDWLFDTTFHNELDGDRLESCLSQAFLDAEEQNLLPR